MKDTNTKSERIKLKKTRKIDKTIETNIAAIRAGTSRQTIINWCKRFEGPCGLGVKRFGRWKVDPIKLQLIIEGRLDELDTLIERDTKSLNRRRYQYVHKTT